MTRDEAEREAAAFVIRHAEAAFARVVAGLEAAGLDHAEAVARVHGRRAEHEAVIDQQIAALALALTDTAGGPQ